MSPKPVKPQIHSDRQTEILDEILALRDPDATVPEGETGKEAEARAVAARKGLLAEIGPSPYDLLDALEQARR